MINKLKQLCVIGLGMALFTSCQTPNAIQEDTWQDQLTYNLSKVGARNWIVIAESSFPAYSGTGTTTLVAEKPADEVFSEVLNVLEGGGHASPRIMVCSELQDVPEDYAPGIKKYRSTINKLLPGRPHFTLKSNIINGMLTDAVKQFQVLVIKTTTSLPYSNIFIELDSSYWSADSESVLRKKIAEQEAATQKVNATPKSLKIYTGDGIQDMSDQLTPNIDLLPNIGNAPKTESPNTKPIVNPTTTP